MSNNKKDKLGYFNLLFWQSKFVILGALFIFIVIPIFGFYFFLNKKITIILLISISAIFYFGLIKI